MTTPLHVALGRYGQPLSFDMVQQACAEKIVENDELDWKSHLHLTPDGDRSKAKQSHRLELAKDIAAMANSRGGLIVCGVREADDSPNAAGSIVDLGDLSDDVEQRRIRQVAYNLIHPPVQVRFHPLTDGITTILAIEVPESDDCPHLIKPNNRDEQVGWLCAPYRSGSNTEIMVEKQIEAAYRQRFDGRRRRNQELRDLVSELAARRVSFPPDDDHGTVLAIIRPINRRTRAPLTGASATEDHAIQIISSASYMAHTMASTIGGGRTRELDPNKFALVEMLSAQAGVRRGPRRHSFHKHQPAEVLGDAATPERPGADLTIEIHDDGTLGMVWRRGGMFDMPTKAPDPRPALAVTDLDAFAIALVALVWSCNRNADSNTADYQVAIEVRPRRPLHVLDTNGQPLSNSPVPAPPPLETEIRFRDGPDALAADVLALGHDLNNLIEQPHTVINNIWSVPRGSHKGHPVRELARELFDAEPDHPLTGQPMA